MAEVVRLLGVGRLAIPHYASQGMVLAEIVGLLGSRHEIV